MSSGCLFDDADLAPPADLDVAEEAEAAPRLRTANRRQVQLRPVDLESLLAPDHDARAMWLALERLDLGGFYAGILARGSTPGRAATDPQILLCLWLYATSQGVGSARQLARLCDEHDAYRWICGGVSVNHTMLAEFRVGHGPALDELMTQLLGVFLERGLVTLHRVAQDGTRVRAAAGAGSFRREKALKDFLKQARLQIQHVTKLADEDPSRSHERAAQDRAAKDRLDRIERALKRLPEAQRQLKKQHAEARVSTTDPDARVMKMADGGFRPAFNLQFATDADSRVIVGVGVTNSGSDMGQLTPMLDQVVARLAQPEVLLVDGGYAKRAEITDAERRGVTVYAPVQKSKKDGSDCYARQPEDTDEAAAWRARMATDDAKEIYKARAATAETVHADLRTHRGLGQLLVRGITKVTSIALLMGLTYNVLKAISTGALD
jgi:transposase